MAFESIPQILVAAGYAVYVFVHGALHEETIRVRKADLFWTPVGLFFMGLVWGHFYGFGAWWHYLVFFVVVFALLLSGKAVGVAQKTKGA